MSRVYDVVMLRPRSGPDNAPDPLSLSNLDFSSPDASQFIQALNVGQKVLIQGLVKLLNPDAEPNVLPNASNPYAAGSSKASSLSDSTSSGSCTIKSKIGKLFNFGGGGSRRRK